MLERNADADALHRIRYRIGIHTAEIVIHPDDIEGYGVVVAERLQQLALPGGVCVSRNVFEYVRNKSALIFEDLGLQKVKDEQVHAFRLVTRTASSGLLFSYEKDIIRAYINGNGTFPPEMVEGGLSAHWPQVRQIAANTENPIRPEVGGAWRNAKIRVDARLLETDDPSIIDQMVFPEAGPRRSVIHHDPLRVAILVSGGIAPGINAAIEGIASRHHQYADEAKRRGRNYDLELEGYQEGYKALIGSAAHTHLVKISPRGGYAIQGGSLLATARADELLGHSAIRKDKLTQAANKLHTDRINILYVIGGDGSMRAAHAIGKIYRDLYRERELIIVGIPKTMDNDILWVWQSFGFLSAVERAREFIQHLHMEVTSNPRLAVVQLFGSDSGFVVSHAALGSGVCDVALIPEMAFTIDDVFRDLYAKLNAKRLGSGVPSGIVLIAETALPIDVEKYLDRQKYGYINLTRTEENEIKQFLADGRRVRGQTPDDLRSATLKIVSRDLQQCIKNRGGYWSDFRVFVNEPRHLIRSMAPTATEAIFAKRLGTLAVDSAMAGFTDIIVSQWLTEFVLVPLELAVLGKKRVPLDGMFWKAVEGSTRQQGLGDPLGNQSSVRLG